MKEKTSDAASGFPGSRLAGGTWWSPQAAVATWQGTNLDKPVLTVPSAHYWLVWTETGWTTPPHEGSGVLTRVARRRGATSAWTSGQDEAAKFRLFCELLDGVNITTIGPACSDTNGLVGSLFTNALATVPNPGFRVEGTGLPAGALTFLVLGFNKNWSPVPLGALAPGCFLNTDQVFLLQSQTGSGGIRSASALGHVHFGMPIPSDPKLIGFLAAWQMATVDSKSSNALPLVFTNGLRTTFY